MRNFDLKSFSCWSIVARRWMGVQLLILRANAESDFTVAFAALATKKAELLVCGSPFFDGS